MPPWTLAEVERAVRAGWGADTCDPADLDQWQPGDPSRGQCGVTALVLNDLLGGELMLAEVHRDGERVGVHYWNRFGAELEIDLTREQFGPGETVGTGHLVARPPGPPLRCAEQYGLLRDRALRGLGQPEQGPGDGPLPAMPEPH